MIFQKGNSVAAEVIRWYFSLTLPRIQGRCVAIKLNLCKSPRLYKKDLFSSSATYIRNEYKPLFHNRPTTGAHKYKVYHGSWLKVGYIVSL